MRILSHDFGGYPYPAELSRSLAKRGHEVIHAFCPTLSTTPGGAFEIRDDDSPTLRFEPLDIGEPIAKYSFVKRFFQERQYGKLAAELTRRLEPDVVLSANMPLDAQKMIQSACRRNNIALVFWLQDVLGVAADRLLRGKIPLVGGAIGRHYLRLEAKMLRRSDAVVPITDDFKPLLRQWKVDEDRIVTVENWAPLADMPLVEKDNEFSREAGLVDDLVLMYAGTMGMKHNPELIAELARQTQNFDGVKIVVLSQGLGADHLRRVADGESLDHLMVRGFEPLHRMPMVLGAADVLIAVLEPAAGAFSVPSKVLSYLCGGKPLLTAMPTENLASRIVVDHGAGLSVPPDDVDGFVDHGLRLIHDAELRRQMGQSARQYAEKHFEIEDITDRFVAIFEQAIETNGRP